MIRVTGKERRNRLAQLKHNVKDYPVVPVLKTDQEVEDTLKLGILGFVADAIYWQSKPKSGGVGTLIREIEPWGIATIGYHIRGPTIRAVIDAINTVVAETKEAGHDEFVYFMCKSPQIPLIRTDPVQEQLNILNETIYQLEEYGEIDDEYYDY